MLEKYVDREGKVFTTGSLVGSSGRQLFALYKDGKIMSPLYETAEQAQAALEKIPEIDREKRMQELFGRWRDATVKARQEAKVGYFSERAKAWSREWYKKHPCPTKEVMNY